MALRFLRLFAGVLVLVACFWSTMGLLSNPPHSKAVSDLKDTIVKGLGLQADDIKVAGFDTRDALLGHSVAYEFDIEIDNQVLPLKLLEDVNKWDYVDLPMFRAEDSLRSSDANGLVERQKSENELPVLAPFQLAGPMELFINDAKDMRLSLPHDVDAGVLKKVILASGAVVTVKGARSVSLRHPLNLLLPLNRSHNGFASGLLTMAQRLRDASGTEGTPPLSLRIVGPTFLTTAPSSSSPYSNNRLKLKRLAPGLVELSSPSKNNAIDSLSTLDLQEEATTLPSPHRFTTMWPLASINGSNSNLLGFEALLSSVLGPKANKKGSIKLLKVDVSALTFLKIGFGVEKKLKEGDGFESQGFPEWRTKSEMVKMQYEVLAKIDGEKVVPERIVQVNPPVVEDSVALNVLLGNMTMSTSPIVHPPSNPFTL